MLSSREVCLTHCRVVGCGRLLQWRVVSCLKLDYWLLPCSKKRLSVAAREAGVGHGPSPCRVGESTMAQPFVTSLSSLLHETRKHVRLVDVCLIISLKLLWFQATSNFMIITSHFCFFCTRARFTWIIELGIVAFELCSLLAHSAVGWRKNGAFLNRHSWFSLSTWYGYF